MYTRGCISDCPPGLERMMVSEGFEHCQNALPRVTPVMGEKIQELFFCQEFPARQGAPGILHNVVV